MSGFNLELMSGVNSISSVSSSRVSDFANDMVQDGGAAPKTSGEKGGVTFADLLKEKINETDTSMREANAAAEELVAGKSKDLHGAMIALEKADVSFRMLMQVRNKMIDAYREIMRMQV